jgi:dTDP-4-amino-4,6-dideoxygalactose transaminase
MPGDSDDFALNIVGYNFRMVEATAALGWVQTSKLEMVNEIRKRNYQYLRVRLDQVAAPYLVPQCLTHPGTFYGYTAAFRWLRETSGISRDTVALALRAEGIPVAIGVGRLMSDNLLFQRKLAYGRQGHPFMPPTYQGQVDYDPAKLPIAHLAHDVEYLGFFLMGHPNTPADMDDIVAAFEKIIAGRAALAEYEKSEKPSVMPFDRGRG